MHSVEVQNDPEVGGKTKMLKLSNRERISMLLHIGYYYVHHFIIYATRCSPTWEGKQTKRRMWPKVWRTPEIQTCCWKNQFVCALSSVLIPQSLQLPVANTVCQFPWTTRQPCTSVKDSHDLQIIFFQFEAILITHHYRLLCLKCTFIHNHIQHTTHNTTHNTQRCI